MGNASSPLDYRDPEWVAEKLGIDKNTVYRYLQEGWIPALQIGRKWLISEQALAEHMERESQAQTALRRAYLTMTPRARRVMELANEAAGRYKLGHVGTEHLLLGIAGSPECLGAVILKNLGVDLSQPRKMVEATVGVGAEPVQEKPDLTPRARTAIRMASEEAAWLGHSYIGPEHILTGVLLEGGGVGHRILISLGITLDRVRAEVARLVVCRPVGTR